MVSAAAQQGTRPACDRACLEKFVDSYLDAMDANRVDPQLFAREVKFTENGAQLPLGDEGLWQRMSGKGTYVLCSRRRDAAGSLHRHGARTRAG